MGIYTTSKQKLARSRNILYVLWFLGLYVKKSKNNISYTRYCLWNRRCLGVQRLVERGVINYLSKVQVINSALLSYIINLTTLGDPHDTLKIISNTPPPLHPYYNDVNGSNIASSVTVHLYFSNLLITGRSLNILYNRPDLLKTLLIGACERWPFWN